MLRGAKAIADKVDYGSILLSVTNEDLLSLEKILSSNIFEKPTIKMSIYKNRRGRYKGVYLWCKADLGCCRIKPMFCTGYDYEMISIECFKYFVSGSFIVTLILNAIVSILEMRKLRDDLAD